jgi:hypothetical protein
MKTRHMRCDCERPGVTYSGVRGILAGPPNHLGQRFVERCDACERFASDERAALEYARLKGGGCQYDRRRCMLWTPA